MNTPCLTFVRHIHTTGRKASPKGNSRGTWSITCCTISLFGMGEWCGRGGGLRISREFERFTNYRDDCAGALPVVILIFFCKHTSTPSHPHTQTTLTHTHTPPSPRTHRLPHIQIHVLPVFFWLQSWEFLGNKKVFWRVCGKTRALHCLCINTYIYMYMNESWHTHINESCCRYGDFVAGMW